MAGDGEEYTELLLELLGDVGTTIENAAPPAGDGVAAAAGEPQNLGDGAAAGLGALALDAAQARPQEEGSGQVPVVTGAQEGPAPAQPEQPASASATQLVVNGATGPLFLPLHKSTVGAAPPPGAFVAPSTLPELPQQQQQPAAAAAAEEASKEAQQVTGQRRKRLTSTQVMADLQAQVARQVALAKQLHMNNIWLAERMRIMELVRRGA